LDIELLQVDVGILLRRALHKADHVARAEGAGELIHRCVTRRHAHEKLLPWKTKHIGSVNASIRQSRANHQPLMNAKVIDGSAEADVPVEHRAPFAEEVPPSALKIESFEKPVVAQLAAHGSVRTDEVHLIGFDVVVE